MESIQAPASSTLAPPLRKRQRQVQQRHGLDQISQVVGSADSSAKYELHYQRLVQPAAKAISSSSSSASSTSTPASGSNSRSGNLSSSNLNLSSAAAAPASSAAAKQMDQQKQQRQSGLGSRPSRKRAPEEREQQEEESMTATGNSSQGQPEREQQPPPYASASQDCSSTLPAPAPPGSSMLSENPLAAEVAAARFKTRDLSYADDGVRVRVEFYDSENTLKERLQMYFIKDHTVSLYVRTAKLLLNVLSCYLYICRVIMDRGPAYATCYGCQQPTAQATANFTESPTQAIAAGLSQQQQSLSKFDTHPYDGPINFRALFWVDRGPILWSMQTAIAVICLLEALLMQYLTYKNSIFSIISFHFTLELVTNTPFIISVFWKQLRTLFVPGFLNCWLAKQCLEAMLNGLSIVRQSSVFSHRLTILSATVFCLIFTSACGFQHTQRSGGRDNITIFESIYFVIVTFSTVGFGDFKPETWPSQLFIMVMIVVALIVLPTQFEQLAYFWIERKKLGASYAHHSSRHEKHVVVCSTTLRADTIMDFLNEFYAHPLLQTFSVVLLSPCELDTTMKLVLQTPTWNNRVVYIQGSALKGSDLIRARMQSAEACFILAARNYNDRSAADEHTILRSWAIRDFSPYVPQYVQIFRTENKIHVAFAEHVVCDDEFKYALLANNCLIPGTSTLVTLLLHTSQRESRRRRRVGFGGGGSSRGAKRRRRCRQRQRSAGLGLFRSLFYRAFGSSSQGDIRRKINDAALRLNNHQTNNTGDADQEAAPAADRGPDAHAAGNSMRNDNNHGAEDEGDDANDDDDDDDEDDDDGAFSGPEWKRLYGKCSANEIYHIRLSDSRFFGEYQGKSFTYASFHSHRKFGVALIGIQTDMRGTWPIMLNPGPSYVLKSGDILFYINITKEENSTLMPVMYQDKCRQPYQSLAGEPPASSQWPAAVAADSAPIKSVAVELPVPVPLQQQPPPPSPLAVVDASATYIRIESSSPIAGLVDREQQEGQQTATNATVDGGEPTGSEGGKIESARLLPAKHSIADGAGILARSLCSMAGIETAVGRRGARNGDDEDGVPLESHHLALSNLFAKRTSSASTSAAMEVVGSAAAGVGRNNGTGGLSAMQRQAGGSTLELAALASGLRKGSNMSICSSNRSKGDVSPTRLKQVVSGLAVKMKRVKLGKSLTHLTIPRMDYHGSNSACSSTESFVNARGRRPSIAPVPAMMGESEEHDSDHDREQESYFSTSWQSSSESSPIVKKFVFCTTYVGVSPTLCYLLQKKKPACCLQLVESCSHCPFKNARQYNWPNRCIILASDFASNGIYNFLVPLRAHFHNPSELRPIVLLLERTPSPLFIDAISWFPMVYWMPGSIDNLDDLINAGINLAHSVVVTNKESTNSAEEDYLADCNTIVAVQTMFKMFPSVGIITELSQSSNMRFMQFRAHDVLFGGLSMANYYPNSKPSSGQLKTSSMMNIMATSGESGDQANNDNQQQQQAGCFTGNAIRDRIQLRKLHSQYYTKTMGKEVNSHAYKYRLPFAAGNVFSASMLDTLLYQAFVKDYMITMVRLLLGIDQAPGSGFLSSMKITKDDLWIRTYGRLYQRLCSTTCEIPLGIYRTEPLETQNNRKGASPFSFNAFASQQASYEHATEELERIEITNMVKNRLRDLGMLDSDYDDSLSDSRTSTFSYVIINPNCDIHLREGDIIYLIRPSPIHSRKLFMHRANSVRHSEAPKTKTATPATTHTAAAAAADSAATTTMTKTTSSASGKTSKVKAAGHDDPVANRPSKGSCEVSGGGCRSNKRPSQTGEHAAMKSCLSDGDFAGILIKVNDEQNPSSAEARRMDSVDSAAGGKQQNRALSPSSGQGDTDGSAMGSDSSLIKNRRRSSCSDAEDSKRFDSMTYSPE